MVQKRPFWPTNWFFWASRPQTWFDRGIKGSKAKHTKIRDYYARVNAVEDLQIEPDADIEFPSPTLVDKAKTYDYGYKVAESVTAQLTKQYESKLKTAAIKFQDKLHEKTCKSVGLEITVLQGLGEWRIDCKNRALTEKLSDFESTKLQLNGAQARISQLESTTKLFTQDEIVWAQNRNEKKVKRGQGSGRTARAGKGQSKAKGSHREGYRAGRTSPYTGRKAASCCGEIEGWKRG